MFSVIAVHLVHAITSLAESRGVSVINIFIIESDLENFEWQKDPLILIGILTTTPLISLLLIFFNVNSFDNT